METELQNPVIKDEVDDQAFLEAAAQVDKGQDISIEISAPKPEDRAPGTEEKKEEPDGKPKTNSETVSETAEQKAERLRDEKGRFTKKDGLTPPVEGQVQDEPSDFEKKKQEKSAKEKERQDRSWEALNKEKDEVRAEAQRVAQEKQQLSQQVQKRNGNGEPTSRDLANFANESRGKALKALGEGEVEVAKEHFDLADKAWAQANKVRQGEVQEQYQHNVQQFESTFWANADKEVSSNPELAKVGSPLAEATKGFLDAEGGFLRMHPKGFSMARQAAEWKLAAGRVSELEEQNSKLTAENQRLNGLTTPSSGGPAKPGAPKTFESMSGDEQEAKLLEAAKAYDSGR